MLSTGVAARGVGTVAAIVTRLVGGLAHTGTIKEGPFLLYIPLRGTIVNRTYGTHKHLYINLFLLTMLGPVYYGPPK